MSWNTIVLEIMMLVAMQAAPAAAPVPGADAPAAAPYSEPSQLPAANPNTPTTASSGWTYQPVAPADSGWSLLPSDSPFKVSGWLNGGYGGNASSPTSNFNGPYNAVDRNEPMFNQAYLILEKTRPDNADFGVGGRIDLLYGEDFILAQSVGLETRTDGSSHWNNQYYGLALPQAYAEFGHDSLSVQVGHFYTIVGYEGVPAAGNHFYSKAYSYQFAGPFTQWGALATWKPGDNWKLQAGPVNSWNTLDGVQDHVQFLGKATYTSDCQDWWTSFAIITGQEPNNVAGLPGIVTEYANRTRYSFIVDKKFGGFEYVFHHWLGAQQNGTANGTKALWYGLDQYLYYTLSDTWKLGGRFEWFNDEDGTRVGLNRPSNPNKPPLPGNYYSLSVGPNYTPTPNLVVRPGMRYDVYDGDAHPFNDGHNKNQFTYGFDVIYKF